MIAAAVPGRSDRAPRGGTGRHVHRDGTWLTFDVRRSLPISIIDRCAPDSPTLSDFNRPELVRTSWTAVRDGRVVGLRTRYCVELYSVWTDQRQEVIDLPNCSYCCRISFSPVIVCLCFYRGRTEAKRGRMPPVIEVYNRVVQCQANQRHDRPGRRRRHFSEQSIKTETPSENDVSYGIFTISAAVINYSRFLV